MENGSLTYVKEKFDNLLSEIDSNIDSNQSFNGIDFDDYIKVSIVKKEIAFLRERVELEIMHLIREFRLKTDDDPEECVIDPDDPNREHKEKINAKIKLLKAIREAGGKLTESDFPDMLKIEIKD